MSTSAEPTPSEATIVLVDDEMDGARPVACWSVRECDWRGELPDEVVELLAPPVIVSAQTFAPAAAAVPIEAVAEVSAAAVPAPADDVETVPWPAEDIQAAPWPPPPTPFTPWLTAPSLTAPSPAVAEPDVPAEYSPRHAAPEGGAPRLVSPALTRRLRRRRPSHAA